MAAVLAGCRKYLVSTGCFFPLLYSANGCKKKKHSSAFSRSSISDTVDSFQSGEAFAGQRALTIVSSLGAVDVMNPKSIEAMAHVSSAGSQQKWKYGSQLHSFTKTSENATQYIMG